MKGETVEAHLRKGPLFLIGMPRSGTKLLRALLNQHPQIAIPLHETNFFPYWSAHWDEFGDLSDHTCFQKFANSILETPYGIFRSLDGYAIDCSEWYRTCENYTPAGIFEALIRQDINATRGSNILWWGDKSPSYTSHISLLKAHFPQAKFIHIVRDVRDYCLSMRNAWGMNMRLAAQRWADRVEKARFDARAFSDDYIEVKYEDLLEDHEKELRRLCGFMGVPFSTTMLSLSGATENLGDTTGKKEVVRGNREKHHDAMSNKLRSDIEAIACSSLGMFGYEFSYQGSPKRLSKGMVQFYKAQDFINQRLAAVRRHGLVRAYKFFAGYQKG